MNNQLQLYLFLFLMFFSSISFAKCDLGEAYSLYMNDKYEKSIYTYSACLSYSKSTFINSDSYLIAYAGLGFNYLKLKEYTQAKKSFLKSVEVIERKREIFTSRLNGNSMFSGLYSIGNSEFEKIPYFTNKTFGISKYEIYENLVYVLYKLNEIDLALEFSEKVKDRVLLDLYKFKFTPVAVTEEGENLLKNEKQIEFEISEMNSVLNYISLNNRNMEFYEALKYLKRLKIKLRKLSKNIQLNFPQYGFSHYPSNFISNTKIKSNTIVVKFEILENSTLIFYITSDNIFVRDVPIQRIVLKKMVLSYLDYISYRPSNISTPDRTKIALGKKIYTMLFGSYFEKIKTKNKLVVITDEFLSKLPFDSLVVSDSNLSDVIFLIDKYEIIHSSSLSFYRLLNSLKMEKANEKRIFSCLNPNFNTINKEQKNLLGIASVNEKKLSLPHVPKTGKILDKVFTSSTDVIYQGDLCNEQKIYNSEIQLYKYILFATHAIKINSAPSLILSQSKESKVELANLSEEQVCDQHETDIKNNSSSDAQHICLYYHKYDNIIETTDIINYFHTNANLVYLLACGAEENSYVKGEGVLGLGKAFLYSGSKNTITTLWSVPENEGVKFTQIFFHYLLKNIPIETSLKITKQKFRKQLGYSHPYYWASYIHLGNEQRK